MPFVHEIQIKSSNFPGAPGYTNLYFLTSIGANRDAQFTAVKGFLDSISGVFPTVWSGQIASAGRVLEATTGVLAEFSLAPTTATTPVAGQLGTGYGAGVAGAVLGWNTATVNRGRVVRGRTFLVPMSAGGYDADGTLQSGIIANLGVAAGILISANVGFSIWSRPRLRTGGILAPVLTHRVNDKAAFLSSRRS